MGKGGGGDGGASARAEQMERERRERIAGNIRAVKEQFYTTEEPREVPDPIMGQVEIGKKYAPGTEGQDMSLPTIPVYGERVTNQDAIDEVVNWNKARPFTDQPIQARLDSVQDIENRVRERYLPDFEQDIGDAKRELKFALSRRSLLHGSAQADAEGRLMDRIGEGRRSIDQKVASARSEKESLDQQLMNNLISQAQSDVSRGSLLGGIEHSFLANRNRAVNLANQQAFGNIFQDVGSLFKEINDQRAIQTGLANSALLASRARNNPVRMFSDNKSYAGDVIDDV